MRAYKPIPRRTFLLLFGKGGVLIVLAACSRELRVTNPPLVPTPTQLPLVISKSLAPASSAARAFLDAWSKEDYGAMYEWLTPQARLQITRDNFVQLYEKVNQEMLVTAIRPTLLSTIEEGNTATAQFRVRLDTALLGDIEQDNAFSLLRERERWGIVWSYSLVLKELTADRSVKLYPSKSTRGNIYGSSGAGIALGAWAVEVSVWPAELRRNQVESQALAALVPVVGMSLFDIQRKYAGLNSEWKIPIATIAADIAQSNTDALSLPGILTAERETRTYPLGAAAAHLGGYIGEISGEEADAWRARGFRAGDIVGRAGLELAAEKYLSGERGGRLVIVESNGAEVATIKEKPATQSQSIVTTIDVDLQQAVDAILGARRGSIIVMDVRTGNILALVSHPSYDPNAFVDSARQVERKNILTSPQKMLLNRATQGAYPHGSVQKIITAAAALERGGMTPNTTFVCNGVWYGLGYPKQCWIWAYGKTHGVVSLPRALTVSCDIAFYQIGQRLDRLDRNLMPSYAYAFGLGSPTGGAIEENDGNVPDPEKQQPWTPTDPVDMAIGQDTFLVSPLQVVDFVAAVANSGTLWRPRLIAKIHDAVNGTEETSSPEKRGVLPLSAANLQIIRAALKGVTTDKDGTAKFVFDGLKIPCAGKTGTAQVPGKNDPHAWFAGYAPADDPELACVVMIENGGEGSKVAAPLFRKVIEKYYNVPPLRQVSP